jgi:hypothetical protein
MQLQFFPSTESLSTDWACMQYPCKSSHIIFALQSSSDFSSSIAFSPCSRTATANTQDSAYAPGIYQRLKILRKPWLSTAVVRWRFRSLPIVSRYVCKDVYIFAMRRPHVLYVLDPHVFFACGAARERLGAPSEQAIPTVRET